MKSIRNRRAWVLLAVAAMVMTTLARAEAGGSASAYAHPVFAFLTGHSSTGPMASSHVPQFFKNWSAQRAGTTTPDRNDGMWQAMLPVLFIGLVAPLSLVAFRTATFAYRVPSSPALPSSFQRPPPTSLA